MRIRWSVMLVLLIGGCSSSSTVAVVEELPPPIETTFDRLPAILAEIKTSSGISLHEGLPGNFWEPNLREQELKNKQTIRLYGYPFYDPPLQMESPDCELVTAVLSTTESFKSYGGSKAGGDFNADYCIEWKTAGAATHALVSLEGGEVKWHGPQGNLHCDIHAHALQKLKSLVGKYRKNRPEEKTTP